MEFKKELYKKENVIALIEKLPMLKRMLEEATGKSNHVERFAEMVEDSAEGHAKYRESYEQFAMDEVYDFELLDGTTGHVYAMESDTRGEELYLEFKIALGHPRHLDAELITIRKDY